MLKLTLAALSFVSIILISLNTVFAANFAVTKIGAMDLGGATYPEWWYSGTNPTIMGTGDANAEVTIKIDDATDQVISDGAGNWSIATVMPQGDYDLVITQGSSSYSFILHAGQTLPANLGSTTVETSQSTTAVPDTGYNQIAGIGFGLGVALLASYLYISGDTDKKVLFEKRLIKDDK